VPMNPAPPVTIIIREMIPYFHYKYNNS
jgi:hypothetical protein